MISIIVIIRFCICAGFIMFLPRQFHVQSLTESLKLSEINGRNKSLTYHDLSWPRAHSSGVGAGSPSPALLLLHFPRTLSPRSRSVQI